MGHWIAYIQLILTCHSYMLHQSVSSYVTTDTENHWYTFSLCLLEDSSSVILKMFPAVPGWVKGQLLEAVSKEMATVVRVT